MGSDTLAMLPELALFLGCMVALVGGSFTPRTKQWRLRIATAAAIAVSLVATLVAFTQPDRALFDATYRIDDATNVARLVVGVCLGLILMLGADELSGSPRESETYTLLLLGSTGTLLLSGTTDLSLLIAAYLLASIPLYGLIGLSLHTQAPEAALKTYLLGAWFGILLMAGVTILYGLGGATRYDVVANGLLAAPQTPLAVGALLALAGLLFKCGAVPAHFWVPDAAQGASATAATFATAVPKIGALIAVVRLVSLLPNRETWTVLIAVVATLSMTLGNLAAYAQQDPRRLLGWSTVSQVGYLLVPVALVDRSGLGLDSLLYFLGAYTLTNTGAFAVTAAYPTWRRLEDYRDLARHDPWIAGAMLVLLLGLVGTPPTAVFVAKVAVISAAGDAGFGWLAVVVIINTLASLFYYLRWLAPVFGFGTAAGEPMADPTDTTGPPPRSARGAVLVAAAATIALGVGAGAVLGSSEAYQDARTTIGPTPGSSKCAETSTP